MRLTLVFLLETKYSAVGAYSGLCMQWAYSAAARFILSLLVISYYITVTQKVCSKTTHCACQEQEAQLMLIADNGLDAFVGQSRPKNILNPFQVK